MLTPAFPSMAAIGTALLFAVLLPGAHAQDDDGGGGEPGLAGTIQIGGLLPLTGDLSSVGSDFKDAAELAVEDFNGYLAELGEEWRLEIIVEDTATNPVMALEKFQLLRSHGIEVVVGPFTSANTQSVKGYADAVDMLVFSTGSIAPTLAIPGDNVFRMAPDASNQAKAIGKLLEVHGIRALVPLWRGEVYGDGLQEAVADDFESRGGFVHEGVRYHPEPHELGLEVSLLAEAVQEMVDRYGAGQVAIFMISFDEFLQIIQAAVNYDVLKQVRWFAGQAVAGQELLVTDRIASELTSHADFAAIQIVVGQGDRYDDVSSRLTARVGTTPNAESYQTYDAVWVVAKSILEAGSATAADVKAVLPYVAAAHDGAISSNRLNDAGDLATGNYRVWRVVDGSWEVRGKYSSERDFLTAQTGPSGRVEVGVLYPAGGEAAGTLLGAGDFNAFLRGINAGWEMVPVTEDPGDDPDGALDAVRRLHARGVDIILGPGTSADAARIKPYADANGMMIVSCCSTAPSLAIPGDSVHRLFLDDSKQGSAVGSLLESEGVGAVVPIWRGDIYGDDLAGSVRDEFGSRGGITGDGVRYDPGAADPSGAVSALAGEVREMVDLHGAGRVAVFVAAFDDEAVRIILEASGWDVLDDVRWFGSESLTRGPGITGDKAARGFAAVVNLTSMQIAEDPGEVYESVRARIAGELGTDPTAFAYQAYDAAWLVGLSILQAGSADAASVKSVFHEVASDYDGTLGPTVLNEAGDLAAAYYGIWQVAADGWTETAWYSVINDEMVAAGSAGPAGPTRVNGTGFEPDYRISSGGAIHAMRTNPQENALVMEMAASKDGFVEITLPRALIDSRSVDDTDGPFFVLVDGRVAPHQETGTTDHSRTLRIEFGGGSGTIEVIGTWVSVPEFGAVAAIILAGAMAAAAVSARFRPSVAAPG